MKFQYKLILTYGAFLFLFILLLGVYLLRSNTRLLTEETMASYSRVGESLMQQLDNIFDQMDFVLLDLLSREDFKTALSTLQTIEKDDSSYERYYSESATVLKSHLLTYSLQKKYHSIAYMNSKGDFFSSNVVEHQETKVPPPRSMDYPWLTAADSSPGTSFIFPPYADPRGGEHRRLFGFGRVIRENDLPYGYLVAQKPYGELETLFSFGMNEYVSLILFTSKDQVFYGSREFLPGETAYFSSIGNTGEFRPSPVTGRREAVLSFTSANTDLTMVIILDRDMISRQIGQTRIVISLALILLLGFSLVFDYISSRMLTKPLVQVTEFMNRVELNKLPGNLNLDSNHDEIFELNAAFHELIKRLDESARREIRINTGWIQARMDALQEQMNPHFLYNILTVISQKAYALGDREICRTCDEISTMLRYSTSTASRHALLKDEVEHVKNYLSPMKRRLGDDLDFTLEMEEELLDLKVPKIILQPLAENSLNHGYKDLVRQKKVSIKGFMNGGGWLITVEDRGCGFAASDLENKFAEIRREIDGGALSAGFQIGGMGLLNTYARLYLFLKGNLIWEIESGKNRGTVIRFGSRERGEA